MFVQALSGAASFAACLRLFRCYPLAVTPPAANGGYRSMVLMNRPAGSAGFHILTKVREDLFVIRSWDDRGGWDGLRQEIRPGEPVSRVTRQVLTESMPLPHDGALLGWLTDRQVTVMLTVRCRYPWIPGAPAQFPEIRVMPMAGTSCLLQWPPFTASPLDDGHLWEYIAWGQMVDIVPLVTRGPGLAFWVPCPGKRRFPGEGFVVVTENLPGDDYWLPAGVYMDHWTLREGIQAPTAGQLLSLPGVVDLVHQLR